MARYIDAEIYEDKLAEYCKANCKYTEKEREYMCGACDVGNAIEMLDNAPTADVRENVRGEWILSGELSMIPKDIYKCSLCEGISFFISDHCPNCGADMRGGGE